MASCWDKPTASFAATGSLSQRGIELVVAVADGVGVAVAGISVVAGWSVAAADGWSLPSTPAVPTPVGEHATNTPANARTSRRIAPVEAATKDRAIPTLRTIRSTVPTGTRVRQENKRVAACGSFAISRQIGRRSLKSDERRPTPGVARVAISSGPTARSAAWERPAKSPLATQLIGTVFAPRAN